MTLSASKIQRLLTNPKKKQQVVKPEWLFDSIALGEANFSALDHHNSGPRLTMSYLFRKEKAGMELYGH
jgi:hypothetical protein